MSREPRMEKSAAILIWRWHGEEEVHSQCGLNINKILAQREASHWCGRICGIAECLGKEPPEVIYCDAMSRRELDLRWQGLKGARYGLDLVDDEWRAVYRKLKYAWRPRALTKSSIFTSEEMLERRISLIGSQFEMLREMLEEWCDDIGFCWPCIGLSKWMCRNAMANVVDFSKEGLELHKTFKATLKTLVETLSEPGLTDMELDADDWDYYLTRAMDLAQKKSELRKK